jgi:hypothetical protein
VAKGMPAITRAVAIRMSFCSSSTAIANVFVLNPNSAAVIFLIFRLLDFENRKSILIFENESYICHNGSL